MAPPSAKAELAGEHERLAALGPDFSSYSGFNARMIDYCFRSLRPWVEGAARCIELGCADGRMSERLAACVGELTAVDGNAEYVAAVSERLPGVHALHALFEELEPAEPYDVAVLGHVLEHVADPVLVLRRAAALVRAGGRLVATVPNGDSLHRQVGVAMGLLRHRQELNASDLRIGHRRVYVRDQLLAHVTTAGLRPIHVDGVFLKLVSDAQIEQGFSAELVEACYEVGKSHPAICANLLVVAERP
jgi:2-polyprenyl-3-methyl-5-hydroxy-6-metoxy-1,4-benzoquinol methylase